MIFAQRSECQSGERFKQARVNGSHVGLKSVLFVTQPKLQIMCFHVLRQLHRLLLMWGQMVNVTAITVVPVSLLSSYQYVLCCGPVCLCPCCACSCVWSVCACVDSKRFSV